MPHKPTTPDTPELENEHRYMALLALTSQELPAKRADDTAGSGGTDMSKLSNERPDFFDQLDADPAALETYLRRERRVDAPVRKAQPSLLATLVDRFAAVFPKPIPAYATALAAAVAVGLFILRAANHEGLLETVERGYAAVELERTASVLDTLVFPWERPSPAVGFGAEVRNASPASVAFARGLIRGKQKLSRIETSAALDSPYAALAEWNVLLWTVGSSGQSSSPEFWRAQLVVSEALSSALHAERAAANVIAHLHRTDELLKTLAVQYSARTARELTAELLLFREQFAPYAAAALDERR